MVASNDIYGKEHLNVYLQPEKAVEDTENYPTRAFRISPYQIIGSGESRAKIIVRLKLEALLGMWEGKSTCKYVNRMNLETVKKKWRGWISTNEIAAGCLISQRQAQDVLKMFQELEVVYDKYLIIRNAKVMVHGEFRYSTKIHMWRIHNPLPEEIYRLARIKLGWDKPHELFRKFKEEVLRTGSAMVTKRL